MAVFGYNIAGAVTSGNNTGDTNFGSRFVALGSGTITDINAYVKLVVAGTAPMIVAVFANGPGNTIGSLLASSVGSVNVTTTSFAWYSCNITCNITAGNEYWLFAWVDTSGIGGGSYNYAADVNAIANTIAISFGNTYPSWATTGDGTNEAYDLAYASIYANYTPSSGSNIDTPSITGLQSITGIQSIII